MIHFFYDQKVEETENRKRNNADHRRNKGIGNKEYGGVAN